MYLCFCRTALNPPCLLDNWTFFPLIDWNVEKIHERIKFDKKNQMFYCCCCCWRRFDGGGDLCYYLDSSICMSCIGIFSFRKFVQFKWNPNIRDLRIKHMIWIFAFLSKAASFEQREKSENIQMKNWLPTVFIVLMLLHVFFHSRTNFLQFNVFFLCFRWPFIPTAPLLYDPIQNAVCSLFAVLVCMHNMLC